MARRREWVAGLDVARFGRDKTALAVRQGPVLRMVSTWQGADLMATCDRVPRELEALPIGLRLVEPDSGPAYAWRAERNRAEPIAIRVDVSGLGAGVYDQGVRRRWPVEEFNASRTPRAGPESRYANRRAESYWELRELLQLGLIALPPREGLVEELVNTRYLVLPRGVLAIEPKQDLVARLGRSPDEADAVAMCFDGEYQPPGQEWRRFRFAV
jgi:hypothetical protein